MVTFCSVSEEGKVSEVYRLRFKTSAYEVELESSDKAYIDS